MIEIETVNLVLPAHAHTRNPNPHALSMPARTQFLNAPARFCAGYEVFLLLLENYYNRLSCY